MPVCQFQHQRLGYSYYNHLYALVKQATTTLGDYYAHCS
jgi:hypothetical protein